MSNVANQLPEGVSSGGDFTHSVLYLARWGHNFNANRIRPALDHRDTLSSLGDTDSVDWNEFSSAWGDHVLDASDGDVARLSFRRAFPDDIDELIIDSLANSKSDLSAQVALTSTKQLSSFAWTVGTTSFLGEMVKELSVFADEHQPGHLRLQPIVRFPAALARKLPTVKTVRISGRWHHSATPVFHQSFYWSLWDFSSVTELVITDLTFASFASFSRLLRALPGLTSLVCKRLNWKGQERDTVSPPVARTHLAFFSLYIEWCPMDEFLNWLSRAALEGHLQIQTLTLPSLNPHDLEQVKRLFPAIGPSLHHLTLGFGVMRMNVDGAVGANIELSGNLHLRTLTLNMLPKSDNGWVHLALSRVKSKCMRNVIVVVPELMSMEYLDKVGCEHIDEILGRPHFKSLRGLLFLYSKSDHQKAGDEKRDQWWRWICSILESRLPLARARGILHFRQISYADVSITAAAMGSWLLHKSRKPIISSGIVISIIATSQYLTPSLGT
ncbi:uncharacterized protein FIBRA_09154 [Fibroporia radiculosa]|uniref:F-box domain-containing protein n=1 Tax=Fibroporia radiculosa TaxID=599839 RepID=J4H5J5_9APHY|nr:uncharacterized protein FIBRA_09154 [Fibroporia radiculosa]CCM06849.1 predicted protein [Fibroporia radiculosa]